MRKMVIELEEQDVEEILELMREISERLKLNGHAGGATCKSVPGRSAQRDH